MGRKGVLFTITDVIVVSKIVIQDQVLNSLLFLAFGLLLVPHCDGKTRIRREIDGASLQKRKKKKKKNQCLRYMSGKHNDKPAGDFLALS